MMLRVLFSYEVNISVCFPICRVFRYNGHQNVSALNRFDVFQYYGHQNVSVLNGGLAKWTKDGYSTTQDETPAKVGIKTTLRTDPSGLLFIISIE